MVKVKEDWTGRTFGRLTVLEQAEDYVCPDGRHNAQWVCECSCNQHKKIIVRASNLKRGHTQSCGCIKSEQLTEYSKLHHKKVNEYKLNLKDDHGLYGIGYCYNTGREFYFDMDDYDKIKDYCWSESKRTNRDYSSVRAYNKETKKTIFIHYIISGKYHDHADRNTFNNRKYNLRNATAQENARNVSISKNNTSGFIGVSWLKNKSKWAAHITINKRKYHLGYFSDKEDAIRARLEAEVKYFGEFAPQRHLFKQYEINVEEGDNDDLS